jgi:hypothetical protein
MLFLNLSWRDVVPSATLTLPSASRPALGLLARNSGLSGGLGVRLGPLHLEPCIRRGDRIAGGLLPGDPRHLLSFPGLGG